MSNKEISNCKKEEFSDVIKDHFIYEDNLSEVIDFIVERTSFTYEKLEKMPYDEVELEAISAVDWMDREQLSDFVEDNSLLMLI